MNPISTYAVSRSLVIPVSGIASDCCEGEQYVYRKHVTTQTAR